MPSHQNQQEHKRGPSHTSTPSPARSQPNFEAWLHRQWQSRGLMATLLWPLGLLHAAIVGLRGLAYRRGWLKSHAAPVPVLVVGNIVVGGAGKTPLLIALLEGLRAEGWNPGVISRGYGARPFAKSEPPRTGCGQLDPEQFGDEPALIAARTGAYVAVHPQRAWAAQALCERHPDIDLILADDGLQHLALSRTLEVVVQDMRGVGNGWLLPAGPLREPPRRLRSVNAIVTNLGSPAPDAAISALPPAISAPPPANSAPGTESPPQPQASQSQSQSLGNSASGTVASHPPLPRRCDMWLLPGAAVRLCDGQEATLAELARQHSGHRIAAVAGIGQPERFFQTLRAAGIEPQQCIALPDHHAFEEELFSELKADLILLTDKDAVKCQASPDPRLWRVPVSAGFSDPEFVTWLSEQLRQLQRAPHLSTTTSRHGSSSA